MKIVQGYFYTFQNKNSGRYYKSRTLQSGSKKPVYYDHDSAKSVKGFLRSKDSRSGAPSDWWITKYLTKFTEIGTGTASE